MNILPEIREDQRSNIKDQKSDQDTFQVARQRPRLLEWWRNQKRGITTFKFLVVFLIFALCTLSLGRYAAYASDYIFGTENGEFIVKEKGSNQIKMRIDSSGNLISQQKTSGTTDNFIFNGGFEQKVDREPTPGTFIYDPFVNRVADGWEQNFIVDTSNYPVCGTSGCSFTRSSTSFANGQYSLLMHTNNPGFTASVASMPYPVQAGSTYQATFSYRCDSTISNFQVKAIYYAGMNMIYQNALPTGYINPTDTPMVNNAYRGRSGTPTVVYNGGCSAGSTFTTVGPISVTVPSDCVANTSTGLTDGTTGTDRCTQMRMLIATTETAPLYIDEVKFGLNVSAAGTATTSATYISAGEFGQQAGGGNYAFPGNLFINGTLTAGNIQGPVSSTIPARNVSSGDFASNTGWGNFTFSGSNIGIGTTSTNYKLTIGGGGDVIGIDNTASFTAKNSTGAYETFLWPRWNDNITYLNYGSGGLNIRNNASTPVMFMTNDGKVGIGTTGPGVKLSVGPTSIAYAPSVGTIQLALTTISASSAINNGSMLALGGGYSSTGTYDAVYAAISGLKEAATDNIADGYMGFYVGKDGLPNAPERMRISSTGNVGIGTTGPTVTLDVVGTGKFSNTLTAASNLNVNGDFLMQGSVFTVNSNIVILGNDTTDSVRIAGDTMRFNNGNVGIGTTGPGAKLHVGNSGQSTGTYIFQVDGTAESGGFKAYGNNLEAKAYRGTFNDLRIGSSYFSTETPGDGSVIISGNVGIGTTGPGAMLDVRFPSGTSGELRVGSMVAGEYGYLKLDRSGATADVTLGNNYPNGELYLTTVGAGGNVIINNGNVGIGTTSPGAKLNVVGTALIDSIGFGDVSKTSFITNSDYPQVQLTGAGGAAYPFQTNGNLLLQPRTSAARDIVFANGSPTPTVKMVIDSTGNVGIGTTGPGAKLSVYNALTTAPLYGFLNVGDNSAQSGSIASLARIAGNYYPSSGLIGLSIEPSIGGATCCNFDAIRIKQTVPAAVSVGADLVGLYLDTPSISGTVTGGKYGIYQADSGSKNYFGGNVGIGTTAPGYKLDVQGGYANASSGLCIAGDCRSTWAAIGTASGWTDGGTNVYLTTSSDNVGVGTSSPTQKLDVAGAVRLGAAGGANDVLNTAAGSAPSGTLYWGSRVLCDNSGNCTGGSGGIGGTGGINYLAKYTASNTIGNSQIYDNGTNVGIGTVSPGGKLEIAGLGYTQAGGLLLHGATWTSQFFLSDSTDSNNRNWGIFQNYTAYGNLEIRNSNLANGDPHAAGTTKFVIDKDGNVGIGTTSLGYKLVVNPGVNGGIQIDSSGAGDSGYSNLYLTNSTTGSGNTQIFKYAAGATQWGGSASLNIYNSVGPIAFHPNGSPNVMYLSTGGNVGIGTTGPLAKLSVIGGGITVGASDGVAGTGEVRLTSLTVAGVVASVIDSNAYGNLKRLAVGSSYVGTTPPTDGAIIQGNVGIGNTGPLARLDLKGAGTTTGFTLRTQDSAGTDRVVIQDNGNVGIGTTGPKARLDLGVPGGVTTPGYSVLRFTDLGAPTYGWTFNQESAVTGALSISAVLADVDTPFVTFTRAGNVGIGTTAVTAGYKLDVTGSIAMRNGADALISTVDQQNIIIRGADTYGTAGKGIKLQYSDQIAWRDALSITNTASGYGNLVLMQPGGNVGIGTTGPGTKLHLGATADQAIKINSVLNDALYLSTWQNMASLSVNRNDATGDIQNAAQAAAYIRLFTAASDSSITFGTTATNNANPTQRMAIDKNGNITITGSISGGTSYSGSGDITSTAGVLTISGTGNSSIAGNVGIGTTTPGYKLDVQGGYANASSGLCIAGDCRANWAQIGGASGWTDDGTVVRLTTSTDNVGIGTTGPLRQLDTTGSISSAHGLNVISRPNEIRAATYRADDATGWSQLSGCAVSSQVADPANGFHTRYLRFTSNADADTADRCWGTDGAHAEDLVSGKTYLISFMYRATNGFQIADRDTLISNVSANTGQAKYFQYQYTKSGTVGSDRFMVRPGASYNGANNNQVDISELTIQNLTDDAPASRFFASADPSGNSWFNSGNVGIGTTSPGSSLSIYKSTAGTQTLLNLTSGPGSVGDGPAIEFNFANDSENQAKIYSYAVTSGTGDLRFATALSYTYSDRMTILSGGNVGIGTTSPAYKLEIATGGEVSNIIARLGNVQIGDADFTAAGTGKGIWAVSSNGSVGINNYYGPIVFQTSAGSAPYTQERMRITETGNVGIGTTGPGEKLHIKGAGQTYSLVESGGASYDASTEYISGTAKWYAGSHTTIATDAYGIYWGGTSPAAGQRLTITKEGNVGIGTTNPTQKLEVAGSIYTSTGNVLIAGAGYLQTGSGGKVGFESDVTNYYVGTDTGAAQVLVHGYNGVRLQNNGGDVLTINSSGNVGIGTTSPGYKLEVNGTAMIANHNLFYSNRLRGYTGDNLHIDSASGASLYLNYYQGSNVYFGTGAGSATGVWQSAGNVGIGMTTPGTGETGRILEVRGASTGVYGKIIAANSDASDFLLLYSGQSADPNPAISWSAGTPLRFLQQANPNTGGTTSEYMRISATGNVGIGTTGPSKTLHIAGDIKYTGQRYVNISKYTYLSDYDEASVNFVGIASDAVNRNVYWELPGSTYHTARGGIADPANWQFLRFGDTNSGAYIFNWANAPLAFGTNQTERMRIDSTGNVGIGTTSPGYKLDVQGGYANASSGFCINGDCRTSWATVGGYWTQSGNNLYPTTIGNNVGIGTTGPDVTLSVVGNVAGNIPVKIRNTNTAGYSGLDIFNEGGSLAGSLWVAGSTTGSTGNLNAVTLAARVAGQKVHIVAGGYDPTVSGGITVSAGNVGIGTTGPTQRLDIVSSTNNTYDGLVIRPLNLSQTLSFGYFGIKTSYSQNFQATGDGTNYYTFSDGSGNNKMVINTAGNVGIGRSSGIEGPLHVNYPYVKTDTTARVVATLSSNEASGFNQLYIQGVGATAQANRYFSFQTSEQGVGDAGNIVLQPRTGNVGIGTTGPGYKLDVSGDIRATGTIRGAISLTGDLDLAGQKIKSTVAGSFIHAHGLGIADSLTTAQNNVLPGYSLYVQNHIKVGGNVQGAGADVAEKLEVLDPGSNSGSNASNDPGSNSRSNDPGSYAELPEPGDVVVLAGNMKITKSGKAYDTKVVGVVSTDPMLIMAEKRDGVAVAMSGTTPVKVVGPVKAGDLLTTSDVPGYAMTCTLDPGSNSRSNDPGSYEKKCDGSIIGKAMEDFSGEKGKIQMLVMMK